jgi:putative protease
MRELSTVPSRGFTYAFHEGRLSHHSHGYEHTATLADWEFAGVIREVQEDAFIVEAKNRLIAGDVLEFIPPDGSAAVLLRLYEFQKVARGEICEVLNPGHESVIRVPFHLFDQEDPEELRKKLPPMSVIRKEKSLTQEEWDRLAFDKAGLRHEREGGSEGLIKLRRDKLRTSVAERDAGRRIKSRRVGTEGCCGKGCNGCLIFWHDPSYEEARALLASKKQGEMLARDMRVPPPKEPVRNESSSL